MVDREKLESRRIHSCSLFLKNEEKLLQEEKIKIHVRFADQPQILKDTFKKG